MTTKENVEHRLDVTGLKCPLPVLRAQKTLRSMEPGNVLVVSATDPVSAIDIPHYCNESGNELLDSAQNGDILIFRIRKSA